MRCEWEVRLIRRALLLALCVVWIGNSWWLGVLAEYFPHAASRGDPPPRGATVAAPSAAYNTAPAGRAVPSRPTQRRPLSTPRRTPERERATEGEHPAR